MGETKDPRAALQSKSVSVRAAAARDLSRIGTVEDLPPLVDIAINERSSALRLYAAAAAADIVHRYRGFGEQPRLTDEQRVQVHRWVRSYDPGRNPGLLMMLSALADDEARKRLARMLRDPRNGVRAGAAMAIRRMAVSATAIGDTSTPALVGECLQDGRIPPDVILELIKMTGELGWQGLRDQVRAASTQGRLHGEAYLEALRRLDARLSPEIWTGFWRSFGPDVFEVGEENKGPNWRIIADGNIVDREGVASYTLADGWLRVEGDDRPVRLVWAARLGQAEVLTPAIQQGDRTWWHLEGRELLNTLERFIDSFTAEAREGVEALDSWLAETEGLTATRLRAIVAYQAGNLDHAAAILEQLASSKKPRMDVYFWLARVRVAQGKKKAAIKLLRTYLGKAGKKARWRPAAEALRKEIG
jgi:tetratricopeptide (TPR) repeat protein